MFAVGWGGWLFVGEERLLGKSEEWLLVCVGCFVLLDCCADDEKKD
jgi:hypothetical protein